MTDEFRIEVELDDDEYGYSLNERLRGLDLDDAARARLGRDVMVTRDGSRIFLYAEAEAQAREAERVMRELADDEGVSADIAVTRWHPVEEVWKDASIPLPHTARGEEAEYAAREAAEAVEAAKEGEFDWHVVVRLPGRDEARVLADRLAEDAMPVARRWRYVVVGALTEERAEEIAERLRAEVANAEVSVEVNLAELRLPQFLFLPF